MESTSRIQLIDYLKAVCVILVIITHYDWADKTSLVFTMVINMAVPVFLILTGYNFAMSNQKKTDGKIIGMYGWRVIKPKLIRFLLPFFVICILEIVLLYIEGKNINLFRIFAMGAYGPGSYYVPVMLQLLVIFPIIYIVVRWNAKIGLLAAAAMNIIFEIIIQIAGVEKYYYRLMIGRYILLIAFGCYLYLHPKSRIKPYQMVCMMAAGLMYIISTLHFDYQPLLFEYWTPTAMPVDFYIFPIVVLLFRKFYHSTIPGRVGLLLAEIGKASYHIFLFQMVYYHFELGSIRLQMPVSLSIISNIVLCVCVGISFYEAEKMFCSKYFKQI